MVLVDQDSEYTPELEVFGRRGLYGILLATDVHWHGPDQ